MSKPRFQLSRIKTANLPYIAADVEEILKYAPGNTPPTPPPLKKKRASKLELADAEISRCNFCGDWHSNAQPLCTWCRSNPYPIIDDIERTE